MTTFLLLVIIGAGAFLYFRLSLRIDDLAATVDALRGAPSPMPAAAAPDIAAADPPATATPPAPEPAAATSVPEAATGWGAAPTAAPRATETAPDAPKQSFEQKLGARWTVWVGGLAIALGAIFLVQYSAQQGFFGPGMRIFLGLLLSAALLGAGEVLRRRPDLPLRLESSAVPVPPVLTAAGCIAGYATVYAAYALYGMIGPGSTFVLLGAISLAAIFMSAVHASFLAGIGLLGSVVTPALIESSSPQPEVLFFYLTFVIGAAIATAELRGWRWLNFSAIAASAIWPLIWLVSLWGPGDEIAISLHLLVLYALQFFWQWRGDGNADGTFRNLPTVASSIVTGVFVTLLLFAGDYSGTALFGFSVYVLLSVGVAWTRPVFVPVTIPSAIATVAGLALWSIPRAAWDGDPHFSITHYATMALDQEALVSYLTASVFGAALYGFAGYLKIDRGEARREWAVASAFVPLALFIVAYARTQQLEQSLPWAALAAGLALYHGAVTKRLAAKEKSAALDFATAMFATATLGFTAVALGIAFRNEWLTIALALLVPGMAWIRSYLDVRALERFSVAVAGVVLVRLVANPSLADYGIGATPVFNLLLYAYGVPVICLAFGAWLYRRLAREAAADILEICAIVLGLVFLTLEINHLHSGGDAFDFIGRDYGLAKHGAQGIVWLAASYAIYRRYALNARPYMPVAASILRGLFYIWLAVAVVPLSPLIQDDAFTEPVFFDRMMIAYLVPALLASVYAYGAYRRDQKRTALFLTVAGFAAGFVYYSLEIRRLFHGGSIGLTVPVSEVENYAYSAAWLLLGAVLLALAFLTRLPVARVASLGLIMAVVAKVFLFDMSGLTGILRAASFLGLGGALIGIGLFYQRVVFRGGGTPGNP
ncbi:MAG: DUF2339 domain-containing protein [Parvibaculum sp.]|uniref:DUF2339 domain-containing protein n=1 Tax=Parvibaculum sp. TaxID=2024848 RepID=UPI002AB84B3E|nr:DUF2339 domain-containing protein [Parvibaculum sp.]MDZ4382177.1 DUF2339 domain-containing protein [Parvibaculum sp.]